MMMRAIVQYVCAVVVLGVMVSCQAGGGKAQVLSTASGVGKTPSFEEFISAERYARSGDFWRGQALEKSHYQSSRIDILLAPQRGRLYLDGEIAMDFPVCTGRVGGKETPQGSFRIIEMSKEKRSTLYGSWVSNSSGKVVKSGVRVSDQKPADSHFEGTSMPYWMRFNGSIGIHVGDVWRRGASHGCVRVPKEVAVILFDKVATGSQVRVIEH